MILRICYKIISQVQYTQGLKDVQDIYIVHSITVSTFYILATAEALAAQVTEENINKGLIFPSFANIRNISAHIAAKVAAKAYDLGKFLPHIYLHLKLISWKRQC